jgi:hypothetical protein
MTFGDRAIDHIEMFDVSSKNPADYAVASSVYGGAAHIIPDVRPQSWHVEWMHVALCGAATPRGGWAPPPVNRTVCPLCRMGATERGMTLADVKDRR